MKLETHQTVARYLLGIIYLFGAVDGALGMFFHIFITGEDTDCSFHAVLQHTAYFWVFLKACELVGAVSLLANYKPAFGLALVTPISAVLCLFYVFELSWFIALAVVIALSVVLFRAYWPSYAPLFATYS
jgi:cell division protein FtsW (lipid II flippase)